MDVSSLLNAAPAGTSNYEELKSSPRTSPKRSSSTTPTPATARQDEGYAEPVDDAVQDVDGSFVSPRSDTRALVPVGHRQSSSCNEQTLDLRPKTLDNDVRSEEHVEDYSYHGPSRNRLHRCTGSQSSISSHESTSSQTHSRTSSVTTVGDDNIASVSFAEAFDDAKLATVHEETSLRARTMKGEQRIRHQLSRPSLLINTEPSNKRNGQQRRNSRTVSNFRGARSSGGLAGCMLPPHAYGSSSSVHEDQTRPSRHLRGISLPDFVFDNRTDPRGNIRHTILQRRRLVKMDRSHGRSDSFDVDGTGFYLSRPGSPYSSEHPPFGAPREPGTPQSAFSYVEISTPNSPSESGSPLVTSASSTNVVVGDRPPAHDTPTKQSRAQAGSEVLYPDLDQACAAQEGCMEISVKRKAISHFFGRNKKCTLLIPAHVWVHMCRKHYQRTRYRNGGKYPMIQVDLIRKQIEKIDRWEKSFIAKGLPSPIRGWTIALRKRQTQNINASTALLVPDWIQEAAGSGYSTEYIKKVAERIERELLHKMYEDIPEIEFLPDIVSSTVDSPSRRGRKQHVRRTSSLSSGYLAGHSTASSLDANVAGQQRSAAAEPQTGANNPYYQAARLNIQRSTEQNNKDLHYFNTQHQTPVEQSQVLPRFSGDPGQNNHSHDSQFVYRGPDDSFAGITMPPPDSMPCHINAPTSAPASDLMYQHTDYSVDPVSGGTHGTDGPSTGPYPYSPYTAYGHYSQNGVASGDQLPSFDSGFGSAWGSKGKQESSGAYDVDATQNRHTSTSEGSRYESAFAHRGLSSTTRRVTRNPFSMYNSTPVPPTPANSPNSVSTRGSLYDGRVYHPSANATLHYMSTADPQQEAPATQAAPTYSSSYHTTPVEYEHRADTAPGASPHGYAQSPAPQYSPWSTSMHASRPRRSNSSSGAPAPEADMDGTSALGK